MKKNTTKEPQYNFLLDLKEHKGINQLGLMMNQVWNDDPRRLAFVLSRYKFIAKMLDGYENVLEVGCGDAFASRIVKQSVEKLTVSDFDPIFIKGIKNRNGPDWPLTCQVHDMTKKPTKEKYDGIYAVDVLEHINPKEESGFLSNICISLKEDGVAIVGIPSLESQKYASSFSKEGHINCKSGQEFKKCMSQYFRNVFLFSMNDEVVHTGFEKMAHYLFTLCCGVR